MSTTPQFSVETDTGGRFVRQQSVFRDWVRADGSTPFTPEAGRYHLYVSLACPWAHRTVIVRLLKGLQHAIPMTVVDPIRDTRGWRFLPDVPDPVNGFTLLSEAYAASNPDFGGRVTVPVLWDTHHHRIVNNESADSPMPNSEFDALDGVDTSRSYSPKAGGDRRQRGVRRRQQRRLQDRFATTQEAYEESFDRLATLASWRCAWTPAASGGDAVTEADWRCSPRSCADPVYVAPRNRCGHRPPTRATTVDCTSGRGSPTGT